MMNDWKYIYPFFDVNYCSHLGVVIGPLGLKIVETEIFWWVEPKRFHFSHGDYMTGKVQVVL